MKKISFFISSLRLGGAEKIVSILLKQKIFYSYLYLIDNEIEYNLEFFDKKNIYCFGDKNNRLDLFKFFNYIFKYKNFCNENKLDYSISFLTKPNLISIISKLFGNRSKIIITEHSLPSFWYAKKNLKSFLAKLLIKNLYNFSDLIIAVSNGVKNDLVSLGINEEKIKIIPNCIDLREIEKKKLNKVDNIKFDKFTFITIGRIDKEKNHKLLIKAMKLLPKETKLIIIGDGELKSELQELINNLHLENRISLVGTINNPYKYLYNSNAFVLSSNHESFSIVLLEALACELPVISTDCISGPREILAPDTDFTKQTKEIELAKYGILTPVGDEQKLAKAMKIIYENDKLREKYSKKAKNRAKDFGVEKIIKEWEKIIERNN